MAKKVKAATPKKRGYRLIRNVDLEIWEQFREWAEEKGKKLGPAVTEALREKLEREK